MAGAGYHPLAKTLHWITALLVRSEEQLRRLAHEFRPAMLDDLGLRPALDYLADCVARRSGLRIVVTGEVKQAGSMPLEPGMTLVRAISQAGGVTSLARKSGWIWMTVVPSSSYALNVMSAAYMCPSGVMNVKDSSSE